MGTQQPRCKSQGNGSVFSGMPRQDVAQTHEWETAVINPLPAKATIGICVRWHCTSTRCRDANNMSLANAIGTSGSFWQAHSVWLPWSPAHRAKVSGKGSGQDKQPATGSLKSSERWEPVAAQRNHPLSIAWFDPKCMSSISDFTEPVNRTGSDKIQSGENTNRRQEPYIQNKQVHPGMQRQWRQCIVRTFPNNYECFMGYRNLSPEVALAAQQIHPNSELDAPSCSPCKAWRPEQALRLSVGNHVLMCKLLKLLPQSGLLGLLETDENEHRQNLEGFSGFKLTVSNCLQRATSSLGRTHSQPMMDTATCFGAEEICPALKIQLGYTA